MILISVRKGSCDDPFNTSTGIYYFGDVIYEYKCAHGKKPVNPRPIQCVMGDTADDMKWNDTFPECKCKHEILVWVKVSIAANLPKTKVTLPWFTTK